MYQTQKIAQCILVIAILSTLLIGAISIIGSGGSDGGGGKSDAYTYTEEGSSLTLLVPKRLGLSGAAVEEIFYWAEQVDFCYYTSGDPVDIVLADAVTCYYYWFLYPENFPDSLSGLTETDVEGFVDYLRGKGDDYTYYLDPDLSSYYGSVREGDFGDMGFYPKLSGTEESIIGFEVEEVYPYTRVWIDGLKQGDRITEVNGESIIGQSLDDFYEWYLYTEEGSEISLTVNRSGEIITIDTAAEYHIGMTLSGHTDIAYLNVRSFTDTTAAEIKNKFEEIKGSGTTITKLILDLRDDGGGASEGALTLIDYFIQEESGGTSVIYSEKNPNNMNSFYFDNEIFYYLGEWFEDISGVSMDETKFVVLVDGGSASASEATCSVLEYYDTATLIGTQTYGKGVSQFIFDLWDGSGIWVTALDIFSPSGETWHNQGITPDYIVDQIPKASFDNDPQLDAAIEFLNSGTVAAAHLSSIGENQNSVMESSLSVSKKPAKWSDPWLDRIRKMKNVKLN